MKKLLVKTLILISLISINLTSLTKAQGTIDIKGDPMLPTSTPMPVTLFKGTPKYAVYQPGNYRVEIEKSSSGQYVASLPSNILPGKYEITYYNESNQIYSTSNITIPENKNISSQTNTVSTVNNNYLSYIYTLIVLLILSFTVIFLNHKYKFLKKYSKKNK
jgi:hypothetical protein